MNVVIFLVLCHIQKKEMRQCKKGQEVGNIYLLKIHFLERSVPLLALLSWYFLGRGKLSVGTEETFYLRKHLQETSCRVFCLVQSQGLFAREQSSNELSPYCPLDH